MPDAHPSMKTGNAIRGSSSNDNLESRTGLEEKSSSSNLETSTSSLEIANGRRRDVEVRL